MKRALLIAAMVATTLVLPHSAGADIGEVTIDATDAYSNASWTSATVGNIAIGYPGWDGNKPWSGFVTAQPAATGCEADSFLYSEYSVSWGTGPRSSPAVVNSGKLTLLLNGAFGQVLCFYVIQEQQFGIADRRIGLISIKPAAVVPPPDPPPTMRPAEAKIISKGKFARKYGRSWRRGVGKTVKCRELLTIFNCTASWKYKGKRKRGTVVVNKP